MYPEYVSEKVNCPNYYLWSGWRWIVFAISPLICVAVNSGKNDEWLLTWPAW